MENFLSQRKVEKTKDSVLIVNGLKRIEKIKKYLIQTSKTVKALQTSAADHSKSGTSCALILATFIEKDRVLPVPNQEESSFLLGMNRFAEVFKEISNLESKFCADCEKFRRGILDFVDKYLEKDSKDGKDKDLRVLRKLNSQYEHARKEYDKAIINFDKLTDKTQPSIIKLYTAQKEKYKWLNEYNNATQALEEHIEDIDDLLITELLEQYITFFNDQQRLFGLRYAQVNLLIDYLIEIKEWCKEEQKVGEEYKKQREEARQRTQKEEEFANIQQFASVFASSSELINIIWKTCDETEIEVINSSLVQLFKETKIPIPDSIPLTPEIAGSKQKFPIRESITTKFEAISMNLLAENHRNLLVNLGGALVCLKDDDKV
eukprot:TRINITY_DN1535_c0_g1_i1.p1 TRINITY_DN1535_c0_g1~~TRINITY_DN1535_c0_g1_i1.p1  ORF type:complete len:377 (+),score=98.84 TRINITY_DN1535_c0_g1_i1:614-1744(+)